MTDHRLTPDPHRITQNTLSQIAVPVADICRGPHGARERQALYGEGLTILAETDGWSYVQLHKDRYCGDVPTSALGPLDAATHRVTAPATHAYQRPDLKSADQSSLSFGSLVAVRTMTDQFGETALGHIPMQHLAAVGERATDPAAIASLFLGTPYLWGGNSRWGIDCSGLIQAAFLACGISCPGDSDQQKDLLGDLLTDGTPFQRNDLIFWKGHVALVLDSHLMIHANAHAMAVSLEPISDAISRIARTDGPVTAHKRVSSSNWP